MQLQNQEVLNAIATLSASIDTLTRAGDSESAKQVITKLLSLVEQVG